MATQQIVVCDLCGSDQDTATMMVTREYGNAQPFELDLCDRCWNNRMADLAEKGRKTKRSNVRPQRRVRKVPPGNYTL